LIYRRNIDGPVTHAFVVGCGRYPNLGADGTADRKAPIAGALAMARMLLAQRDKLIAPLGSIELLLSDPVATESVADIGTHLPDATVTRVDAADERHFRDSGERWLERICPGDVVVFYFSGHGIMDRIGGAVGVLEDAKRSKLKPWTQTFSMTKLTMALRTVSAESAWIFFDACQEVVTEFADRLWEVDNIYFKELNLSDITNSSCEPLALAGAAAGRFAWAPNGDEPPFFTQILLKGLSGCCVEKTREHGWAVTGVTLLYDLVEVGKSIIDGVLVQPQSLAAHSERKALLAVDRPFTPITVRSNPEMHMKSATAVRLMHGSDLVSSAATPGFVWRTELELAERELTVHCEAMEGGTVLAPQSFRQHPPAHNITLTPTRKKA
jgi:hypothetical protein